MHLTGVPIPQLFRYNEISIRTYKTTRRDTMSNKTLKFLIFCIGIATVSLLIAIAGTDDTFSSDSQDSDTVWIGEYNPYDFTDEGEFFDDHVDVFGTREEEIKKYIGVDGCSVCHPDHVEGWNDTNHAKDFTPGGVFPSVNYGSFDENFSGNCANCHVVGMGDTLNGGFDPNERWSNATPTEDQLVGNIDLIGVQCEACHGPASYHVDFHTKDYCADCKTDEFRGSDYRAKDPWTWYKNPSVEESCMGDGDSGCHSAGSNDKYTPWKASAHSNQDQIDTEEAGGELHGVNSYCARCKSPTQYDEYAPLALAEEFSANEWRGIGCGDCHDSHSNEFEYQLRTTVEEACTVCHTNEEMEPVPGDEPHHTQKEAYRGHLGIGVSGQKGMAGVTCVDCHMWETPSVGHGYYMSDAIMIEKHESHSFEATAQACADCHSDLTTRLPEHERPANNTGENEELWNEWDEWGGEWNETVEIWERVIEDWKSNYQRLQMNVNSNWDDAEYAFLAAEENGTVTEETLSEARSLLDDARWNIGLSNDGSSGVHNPDFFVDLLNQANVNSNNALELLTMNGPPLAIAGMSKLVASNENVTFDGTKSSDRDGTIVMYYWDFGDGTNGTESLLDHIYVDEGVYLATLTITDDSGATDTDMITIFVVNPLDIPEPFDLTNIESNVFTIRQDRTEMKSLIEALKANIIKRNEDDREQSSHNKNDIQELDDKISLLSGALFFVFFITLLLIFAIYQIVTANIVNEVRINFNPREETPDDPGEESEPEQSVSIEEKNIPEE